MNTKNITICLLFLYSSVAFSQLTCRPLIEDGKTWRVAWWCMNLPLSHVYDYAVMGDTIVGGKTWKKIYCTCHTDIDKGTRTAYMDRPCRIVREEDGRVYFLRSKDDTEGALLMDTHWEVGDVLDLYAAKDDYLGEKVSGRAFYGGVYVKKTGTITNSGHTYRTWTLAYTCEDIIEEYDSPNPNPMWIEGIGEESHGISNDCLNDVFMNSRGTTLLECRVGDEVLYKYDFPALEQLLEAVSIITPSVSKNGSNTLFDLQGRRLTAEPQHGVFIKGGKKVAK